MDELTGLPTRNDLARVLSELADHWVPAIFVDIDGFLRVNDQLGHQKGDEQLVTLARWLEREGHVFRVGGDEFLMLFPDKTLEQAASLAERLVASCPTVTISAVVFAASREMSTQLEKLLDVFAYSLYLAEVARDRKRSNVVVFN